LKREGFSRLLVSGPASCFNAAAPFKIISLMPHAQGEKDIAVNRRARFDYFIEETYEAGLVLQGSEV